MGRRLAMEPKRVTIGQQRAPGVVSRGMRYRAVPLASPAPLRPASGSRGASPGAGFRVDRQDQGGRREEGARPPPASPAASPVAALNASMLQREQHNNASLVQREALLQASTPTSHFFITLEPRGV